MDFTNKPHPLVKSATLYVADVPADLKWAQLLPVFAPCGLVQSEGKSNAPAGNRQKWTIKFPDIFCGAFMIVQRISG
jgi:hypothetical protein